MNIFMITFSVIMVGLSGLEPPTSRLSGARSNLLSYKPILSGVIPVSIFFPNAIFNSRSELRLRADVVRWWRWWDSNPWPPACRAGALPTELHPHWCVCSLLLQWTLKNLIILQNWTTNDVYAESRRPWLIIYFRITQNSIESCQFSIERRWSSRTFRYGYLVTT